MKKLNAVTTYFDYDDYVKIKQLSRRLGLSESSIVRMCTLYVLKEVLPFTTFEQVIREVVKRGEGEWRK